ncbi:MAG: GNAT family N-acetyltransferase, partial [Anaerolineae bacterium]|nr:GNAT family N-acetyltransferase [Anaerolineae bacterium]
PYWFNLFLGNLGTAPALEWVLVNMVEMLPGQAIWAGAGIGRYQYQVNKWAVDHGGQVRVGLE